MRSKIYLKYNFTLSRDAHLQTTSKSASKTYTLRIQKGLSHAHSPHVFIRFHKYTPTKQSIENLVN